MAVVSGALPEVLDTDAVCLYFATDPYLPSTRWLLFHGPASSANATLNSSRIQAHVFSPAGRKSYPKLIVAPSSPLYAAVHHLPREEQGDETSRGLAVSMLKYFADLPPTVKDIFTQQLAQSAPAKPVPKMFDEMHAATIATRMTEIKDSKQIAEELKLCYPEKIISWIDVDVILPNGSISAPKQLEEQSFDDEQLEQYGKYGPLVETFGEPAFIPTSKIRRAPSRPSKSVRDTPFLRQQKESLRRTMCEIVDTEERYVAKLYELVHDIAQTFREKATSQTSPDPKALTRVFPSSLDQILDINTAFLKVIRKILDDTDDSAMKELQSDDPQAESQAPRRGAFRRDPAGLAIFAKALNEWFPKFRGPYEDYMRASSGFSAALQDFSSDVASSFGKRIRDTGEQRLKALLIEPVQRLPRYSLFIDTMLNVLPASFPSVKSLLKARDIITDICSLETSSISDTSHVLKVLRQFINGWPADFAPKGRLINLFEVYEFEPPQKINLRISLEPNSILLLFTDFVVIARKPPTSKIGAREIQAEIDHAAVSTSLSNRFADSPKLQLYSFEALEDLRVTESENGRVLWLWRSCTESEATKCLRAGPKLRTFCLLKSRQGRIPHFNEQFAKARIEGRFSESVRESGRWALRRTDNEGSLNMLSSIIEAPEDSITTTSTGQPFVRVHIGEHSKLPMAELKNSADLVVIISPFDGRWRLECQGLANSRTLDIVEVKELSSILIKRLSNLLSLNFKARNCTFADTLIQYNRGVLDSLHVQDEKESNYRSFRPPSPVKLLSSLLGTPKESGSPLRRRHALSISESKESSWSTRRAHALSIENAPRFPRPDKQDTSQEIAVVDSNKEDTQLNTLQSLENTFNTYILALESRSGNIVGRILRARAGANELLVNELYNTLLEDPLQVQAAAEVPIDVLFSAFEKFINNALREKSGPILSDEALEAIQEQFATSRTDDFMTIFLKALDSFVPQNRKMVTSLIGLLSRLLNASSNDGDRGALTEAFAELLAGKQDGREIMPLLDCLTSDVEKGSEGSSSSALSSGMSAYKTDSANNTVSSNSSSVTGSMGKHSKHAGSLSSNASSFRKRFGLGKTDSDNKFGSVWRSWGKSSRNTDASPHQSIERLHQERSKSVDADTLFFSIKRPGSSHLTKAPPVTINENVRVPTHSQSVRVGETQARSESTIRKKRRSSLTDLKEAKKIEEEPPKVPGLRLGSPFEIDATPIKKISPKISPRSMIPKATVVRADSKNTPTATPSRIPGSLKKENSPLLRRNTLTDRYAHRKSEGVIITNFTSSPSVIETSSTLASRQSLREIPGRALNYSGSTSRRVVGGTQKLRMQSPQKLRERLKTERHAIQGAEADLQDELLKISQELLAQKQNSLPGTSSDASPGRSSLARVTAIESKHSAVINRLTETLSILEKDVETSLLISEKRVKHLDQLYREANAENEALYERFNDELDKIMKKVKGGQGMEELQEKYKASCEEALKLRRENQRLRRENAGLKSRLLG